MIVDVIILSYAKTPYLKDVTLNALNTLISSESDTEIIFNPIVIESEKSLEPYNYPMSKTYYLKDDFNYNHYMNIGLKLGSAEYVAFCNNDLDFRENWMSKIIHYMKKHNINSASPYCNLTHKTRVINDSVIKGNIVGATLCGWCIVVKRDFFEKLGGFDERVAFYCSDNIYGEQLNEIGEEHALITRSHVNHLVSVTLKHVDNERQKELCIDETRIFNTLFNQNVLGYGKVKNLTETMQKVNEKWHKETEIQTLKKNKMVEKEKIKKEIVVFYHVCCVNNWLDIFKEQIKKLIDSGLYDNANKIFINMIGYPNHKEIVESYLKDINSKITITCHQLNDFESTTLIMLKNYCDENDCYALYFHTKGVYNQLHKENQEAWRRYMDYFNVEKWKDCVNKLVEGFDCCGVNWLGNFEPPYFAGNYFWASSDYVRTLVVPKNVDFTLPANEIFITERCWYEGWIGRSNRKINQYNFHNNQKAFYLTKIEECEYRSDL